jgi:hypothetical protein
MEQYEYVMYLHRVRKDDVNMKNIYCIQYVDSRRQSHLKNVCLGAIIILRDRITKRARTELVQHSANRGAHIGRMSPLVIFVQFV